MFGKIRFLFSVISIFILCQFLLNCNDDDNSVKPTDPTDYIIYFYDFGYYQYLAYHTATGIIDTLTIPYQPNNEFSVSADGQLLFIPSDDIVAVIDANTLETVIELPYLASEVAVSYDGQKIALIGGYLYILNTSDYSVIYADSNVNHVINGVFSKDGKSFYFFSTSWASLNELNMNGTVELTQVIPPAVGNDKKIWSVIPSSSDSRLYLYVECGGEPYLYLFLVYDRTLDSLLFTDSLIPGDGNMALTNDEEYVIYTNPGNFPPLEPDPPYTFKVFNTSSFQIEDEISTLLINGNNDTVFFAVEEICLTPDNKYMLGISRSEFDEVIIYDFDKKEIIQAISLGGYRYFKRPTCQLQVKD